MVPLIVKIPGIVKIDGIEFDDASPEGHYLQFGENGALIAITIVNARWILEQEGKITITVPERRIEAPDLGNVLAAA